MATSAGFFLSPQQQQIWTAGAGAARTQAVVRVEGAVPDGPALEWALQAVVQAEDSLRTVFQRQAGMKMPFQVVLEEAVPVWRQGSVEEGGLAALLEEEAGAAMPADGSQVRSAWFTGGAEGGAWWVLTAHAAVADAASLQKVIAKTLQAYGGGGGRREDEDALPYVQFAQWQNDLLTGDDEAGKEGVAFWAGVGAAEEPLTGLTATGEGAVGTVALAPVTGAVGVDELLAAWAVVVARWSGLLQVELGVEFEGREYEELAELVGAVAKTLPFAVTLEGRPSFAEVAAQVATRRKEAAAVQEFYGPGRRFVAEFAAVTLAPAVTVQGSEFRTVKVRTWGGDGAVRLVASVRGAGVELEVQYGSGRVSREVAEGLGASFEALLAGAVRAPEERVDGLPLLSAEGRARMLAVGAGAEWEFPGGSITELLSAQAERSAGATAVQCGSAKMTYGELEAESNRLARALGRLGVGRGSLAGLCVSRTAGMMVPVLAILKAGGAYVPLSADQPKARTAAQLAGVGVLVTESGLVGLLPEFEGRTVLLDEVPGASEQESAEALEAVAGGEDLAYVIYTSGSTGVPKGVGVRHSNLVNYATAIVRELGLDAAPLVFATVSTLSADLGNTVIYPALLTGGCLHVVPQDVAADPRGMLAYQAEHEVDVLKIVPSHLAALVDGAGLGVLPQRYLITGGEALKTGLLEKLAGAGCEVVNHYGPTETTVGSLMLRVRGYDWKGAGRATIPVGRPLANTQAYVLDALRQLVPEGVAGELYLAGAGVSAGYVGSEGLTRERFVENAFGPGQMYRTGDQVRWLPGGLVEFVGRTDDQVKIRGFRVEPGEVEAVLAAEAGVRQCAVVARARGEDLQLVAYVVLDRQQGKTAEGLRESLKLRLPDYMVPAAVVELPKLPLTGNGKLDRKALPAPEERVAREYKAPETASEERVAEIWSEMLKVQKISRDENFFTLGGHSLLATQVISRVRESFGLEIALRTIFEAPVLEAFAAAVDEARTRGEVPAVAGTIKRVARQAYRG